MPSTYAHYRMGEQVRKIIHPDKARIISRYPQLYRIGIHGPDIFFYYNPLSNNYVKQVGEECHRMTGREFLERAAMVIREHPRDERYLSYFYGLINHFALDASCHGYVAEWMEEKNLSHTEIETEFDRYLMTLDHLDPLAHPLTRHIAAIRENAKIISAFYAACDQELVLKSLRNMITCHNILLAPKKWKRCGLYTLMKIAGRYDSLHSYVIKEIANPECEESNHKLHKYYRKARKIASEIIDQFDENHAFPEVFDDFLSYNFESVKDSQM